MAFSCLFFPANHKVRKQTEKEQLVRVCKKLWFQKPMLVALAIKGLMCNLRHSSAGRIITDGMGSPAGPSLHP
uniref:Uncharacterized protein n=1 Tax=Gallus gallus TaxID=9031 RepID=A0A8V0ZA58_CHICK